MHENVHTYASIYRYARTYAHMYKRLHILMDVYQTNTSSNNWLPATQ